MNRVLLQPVTIKGTNIFGLPAKITFHPVPDFLPPGWYWKGKTGIVPIEPAHCQSAKRRITLSNESYGRLEVFEHIGYLRMLGYNSLAIECHGWPPFDGGAEHYHQALGPHTLVSRYRDDYFKTVRKTVQSFDSDREGWGVRIEPTNAPVLKLHISCDYPGLGAFERRFELSSESSDSLEICSTNTIGLPHRLAPWVKFLAPHKYQKINWLRDLGEIQFKRRILLHRAQDLVGALSLLCDGESMFVGNVYSHCAGHRHDVPAVHLAAKLLECL